MDRGRRGRGRAAARALALALAAAAVLAIPATATADFGSVRKVWSGSAYTLERGELAVGIFSPIQYGILDELTISTHPILDLLVVPNLALKAKALDVPGVAALSFTASYMQAFLGTGSSLQIPGALAVFPTLTIPVGPSVSLSVHGGYSMLVVSEAAGDPVTLDHGVTYGGAVSWLVTSSDLLTLTVQHDWYRQKGLQIPSGILAYTHAFYQTHLTVGLAAGQFPIQTGDKNVVQESGVMKRVKIYKNIPVYPVVDVWWVL